ncbi:hypothetical protein AGLY_016964 [Aphis glycines]|uniref:Uncharacterized protein n=1 Tax=Aphis glycines TaxID=307491 RepID=A0A6G0SWE1_APHGL|nr:hypothetical protein AGLY_016964 [Aphis glycines]
MFTFNGYKHQVHSICSRKPPSKFVIGAFFRLVMLFAVFGHFFFVYLNYSENCWEMFTFNGYKHQGHSICSRKPPSMFVIGAFFQLICRFRSFFFVYLHYFENCWEMFTFNGYKHQGHSICNRKPPSKFVIGAFFRLVMLILFKYRFGRIPVLCKICRFRSFFFSFMSFNMKTVGKCSLLTVISIKDIRFAVENHPQNLPFSVLCFLVYVNYYENCWELFTFNGYEHQGHSICSRKSPSMFVIGVFFRLVMLYKETKKKISEIYK